MPETHRAFTFENDRGHTLSGRLETPEGDPKAYALFAHCFTCSKNVPAASRISRGLRGRGFAVLRFDFTGLGNSDGDFANTDFSSNVGDLSAAAAALRERHAAPVLLVGHSLGGAAVLAAAPAIEEVRAVATIGAPSTPSHVKHLLASDLESISRDGEAEVRLAGRTFRIRREFLEDLDRHPLPERIGDLGRALLIAHSPTDETVGIDEARRIYEAAKHPKSFLSLDRADHLLTASEDAGYVADVIAAWVSRYLD